MTTTEFMTAIGLPVNRTQDDQKAQAYEAILYNAVSDYRRALEQVQEASVRVQEDARRAAENATKALAAQPYTINSLGVLQNTGLALDRAAALAEATREAMNNVIWLGRQMGYLPKEA